MGCREFSDIVTIGGDGAAGPAVVAAYDVNGGTRYDTRIYRRNGTGYSAEGTEQDYYAELIAAARGCIIKNNGEAPEGYDFSSVIYMKREGDAGIPGYLIEDLEFERV